MQLSPQSISRASFTASDNVVLFHDGEAWANTYQQLLCGIVDLSEIPHIVLRTGFDYLPTHRRSEKNKAIGLTCGWRMGWQGEREISKKTSRTRWPKRRNKPIRAP